MVLLLITSLIWAFSFGLIKHVLPGIPPGFVAFVRLAISLLVFLPFLRRRVNYPTVLLLVMIGALQYGVMYVAYIWSFRYLQSYQIALFTVFTPLFVTLLHDLFSRRFHGYFLLTVVLALAGTSVIVYRTVQFSEFRIGFLLVQLSNVCFALGQVWYPQIMRRYPSVSNREVFAWLYLGGTLLAACWCPWDTIPQMHLSIRQMAVLFYLGAIASGIGFFLWNTGARRVNAGALAIMNNLKIPLAVICSVLFFGETANWTRLLMGGGLILAALGLNEWLARRTSYK